MKTRTKVIGGVIGTVVLFLLVFWFVSEKPEPSTTSSDINFSQPGPPLEDHLGAIDRILEKLDFGNIAFNAPKTINLRDTAIIQLMLDLETPVDQLKRRERNKGRKFESLIVWKLVYQVLTLLLLLLPLKYRLYREAI